MKTSKILAVALVTAFIFISMVVPASAASDATFWDYYNMGFMIPSPDYPNRESLPYGDNTAVYEFKKFYSDDEAEIYRIYIRRDLYSGSEVSAYNGMSIVFADNNSGTNPNFEILSTSPATIFYQTFRYKYSTGEVTYWSGVTSSPYTKESSGKIYQFGVKSGKLTSTQQLGYWVGTVAGTDPCYYGGRDLRSLSLAGLMTSVPADLKPAYNAIYHLTGITMSYPTSNDISSRDISDSIDESNEKVIAQIKAESDRQITAINNASSQIQSGINNAASQIEGAITEAVDDLINAGSDMPTLDTDNEWMNDSLTKVNNWLSQLEDFEKQMDEAEADNAENMAQAKSFVDGFFSAVPGPIIAALTLILVVLVAVKIVGR